MEEDFRGLLHTVSPHRESLRFHRARLLAYDECLSDGFRARFSQELLTVDSSSDVLLRRFLGFVRSVLSGNGGPAAIAKAVAAALGGRRGLEGRWEQRLRELDFDGRWHELPLGRLIGEEGPARSQPGAGLQRHRAVLFKYTCDALGVCPSALLAASGSRDKPVNLVWLDGRPFAVDCLDEPGRLESAPVLHQLVVREAHSRLATRPAPPEPSLPPPPPPPDSPPPLPRNLPITTLPEEAKADRMQPPAAGSSDASWPSQPADASWPQPAVTSLVFPAAVPAPTEPVATTLTRAALESEQQRVPASVPTPAVPVTTALPRVAPGQEHPEHAAARAASNVQAYVYDVTQGWAANVSVLLLGRHVECIPHTGIVVFGREYYFGAGPSVGEPGQTVPLQRVQVLDLGETLKTPEELDEHIVGVLAEEYTAENYNLLTHNCNHFAHALARFLLDGRGLPRRIVDIAEEVLSTPQGQSVRAAIEEMERGLRAGRAGEAVADLNPFGATPHEPAVHSSDFV